MQAYTIFAILVQCSVLCGIDAAKKRQSLCQDPLTVPNFDISKFVSTRWYAQKAGEYSECNRMSMDFALLPDNKLNISLIADCRQTKQQVWNSIASVSIPGIFRENDGFTYHVVDTDYDSYAVLWACKYRSLGDSFSFVWITGWSKEKFPSATVLDKLDDVIRKYLLRTESVYSIQQGTCRDSSTEPPQ